MFKKISFIVLMATAFACSDDTEEVIIDTSMPQGSFNVESSGSFVAQNDTGSKGTAELGKDEQGTTFLHFGEDFETALATGTVTVYLSTSDTYMADPPNGNPDLLQIGPVLENGEMYFKINNEVPSKFTHVILWCGSAGIPFGYTELN